jgi:hypothetical protein
MAYPHTLLLVNKIVSWFSELHFVSAPVYQLRNGHLFFDVFLRR